jgi:N-acetyl-gamma-glutamyl-phosphate reductase
MKKNLQTAVMGVTGYAGMELARLLLHHPQLKGTTPLFLGRADAAGHVNCTLTSGITTGPAP